MLPVDSKEFPKSGCFVCSPDNPESLGLEVEPAPDGGVEATYDPPEHLRGPPGVLHGGVQAALLDDMGVWAVYHETGELPVTRRMELDYHAPAPVDEVLYLVGRVADRDGSRLAVETMLGADGDVVTEARLGMRLPAEDASLEE